jgi:hypothetical protein
MAIACCLGASEPESREFRCVRFHVASLGSDSFIATIPCNRCRSNSCAKKYASIAINGLGEVAAEKITEPGQHLPSIPGYCRIFTTAGIAIS